MSPCTRCTTPLEDGDLRCAICALPVPIQSAAIEKPRAQILRCKECHAAIAFSAEAQAPRCGFCGSTMTIEQPVDPVETATLRMPFVVSRVVAESSLRGWLGTRGWFAPKTLRDEAVLETLVPLCWAGWIVTARAHVTWTADSDADSRRSAWAPHSGAVHLTFDALCVPATRGLDHDECRLLVPYYDLARAIPIDREISGEVPAMIESFDLQRSAARQTIQRGIEAFAKTRIEPHIPGRRFRNVHVACLLEGQNTERVALPAWVLAYRYRGKPYRAIVHGQRPEIVFGSSPKDWRKILAIVGGALLTLAIIAAIIIFVAGCHAEAAPPDAPDFFERCEPSGAFAPLTGRAAVQATLNVHVDAGGLIEVDTSSKMLLVMDLAQDGTVLGVTSTLCRVQIPDIPLAGQELPIDFEIADTTVASVGTVGGSALLGSVDASCTPLDTEPITIVLGARIDPPATAPLPTADDAGNFPACDPAPCSVATGTACACDQEGDGKPGATLVAHNVPAVELDEVYVALRTTFALHGRVHTSDLVKGRIDATLETAVLHCGLVDGSPCTEQNVRLVKTLNPIVTPQADNPSTFRAVRVPPDTTCADIIANEGTLFPR